MRDGVAGGVLVVAGLLAVGWFGAMAVDLPADRTPSASFDVTHQADGTVVVEHAGGEPVAADAVRLLVYEDRWLLPTRSVHGSTWGENGTISPGDRRRITDRRIESGHRLVVRWFGERGHATLSEAEL